MKKMNKFHPDKGVSQSVKNEHSKTHPDKGVSQSVKNEHSKTRTILIKRPKFFKSPLEM